MDSVQFTIIIVSVVLTTLVVVLGVQVWNILKEFQQTIRKMNEMLDDMKKVTGTVSTTVVGLSETVSGIRGTITGFNAASALLNIFRKKKTEESEGS